MFLSVFVVIVKQDYAKKQEGRNTLDPDPDT